MTTLCGGIGRDMPATEDVQAVCEAVKADIAGKVSGNLTEFKAISHKTQVVAGTNYFVKIHVGDGKHVHARIYKDLQSKVSLHSIQEDKTEADPIEYF